MARVLVTAQWPGPTEQSSQVERDPAPAPGRAQAPLDRPQAAAAPTQGGRRREPAPSPGAGTLRGGPRLEVGGSGPGALVLAASAQGTPVVAASVRRKAGGGHT
jgi:hypothetical protein